jgi:hypothetical protein
MNAKEAKAYLREQYKHASPWIENFRTSADGPEFTDDFDGPPYTIWHNGGPGGQIGQFDNMRDAQAVIAIINEVLTNK